MGVERRIRDTWDLYVGNITESVSDTQIVDYLKTNGVEARNCYVLNSKIRGTKSARVHIPLQEKDKALDPSFWPEHCACKILGH